MTTFTITVQDDQVRAALKALASRVQNMRPVLQGIGEDIVERTKHRFDTSTGPDGAKWKPNSAATLDMLAARLGKSYQKKGGDLNSKGAARIAGKKPLIGESKHLMSSFSFRATPKDLTVASSMAYAVIQQFGGKAGRAAPAGHRSRLQGQRPLEERPAPHPRYPGSPRPRPARGGGVAGVRFLRACVAPSVFLSRPFLQAGRSQWAASADRGAW